MPRRPAVRRRTSRSRATRTPRWRTPAGGCATWARSSRCRRCGWTTNRPRSPRACSACSSASSQLDGAYARFDDPQDGGRPLETWRPSGPSMPAELQLVLEADQAPAAGRHDDRGRRAGVRHVPGHEPAARAAVGDRPGARVRRSQRLPDGDGDAPAARRGQPGGDRDPHRTSPRARACGALGRRGRAAPAERAPAIARRRRRAVARVDRAVGSRMRRASSPRSTRSRAGTAPVGRSPARACSLESSGCRGRPLIAARVDPPRDRDARAARAGPEQQGDRRRHVAERPHGRAAHHQPVPQDRGRRAAARRPPSPSATASARQGRAGAPPRAPRIEGFPSSHRSPSSRLRTTYGRGGARSRERFEMRGHRQRPRVSAERRRTS